MAWLDPMCGLMLALVSAAAVYDRQTTGRVQRVDFSMVEAMLWTMAEPLIDAQLDLPVEARGNASAQHAPHGIYPAQGDDAWISLVVRDDAEWLALTEIVPGLNGMDALGIEERRERAEEIDASISDWASARPPETSALVLQAAGLAADAVAGATALLDDEHLSARGFWQAPVNGVRLPGLPWRTTLPLRHGPARDLGADTDAVLADVLALDQQTLKELRDVGAFGD
jgi:crotonobetainyl-CoA:carnitine CoA-transferase CaiB-like acyl-CoA transferase